MIFFTLKSKQQITVVLFYAESLKKDSAMMITTHSPLRETPIRNEIVQNYLSLLKDKTRWKPTQKQPPISGNPPGRRSTKPGNSWIRKN